ncbi:MAG: DUF6265 family protein [Telluria sp.]
MNLKLPFACAVLVFTASASGAPLDKLAWLQGCWMTAGAEKGTVEQWTSAEGDSMLGISRTVKGGKTVAFEFMQIREASPGQLTFIAQPAGRPPTSFPLTRQDGAGVVFENPGHDFPQRVIYRPDGPNALFARIEGMSKGKIKGIDFPMQRVSCETTATGKQ